MAPVAIRQDIELDIQLIRLLRNRLWIEHREEWQSVLPLEPTTDVEKVTQAMASLPSAQREAVALVVIDELGYRDAAADIARVSAVTLAERLLVIQWPYEPPRPCWSEASSVKIGENRDPGVAGRRTR